MLLFDRKTVTDVCHAIDIRGKIVDKQEQALLFLERFEKEYGYKNRDEASTWVRNYFFQAGYEPRKPR